MAEEAAAPQPQTAEQFQATANAIRNAPFGVGESDKDRAAKLEAHYKTRDPEPGSQPTKQGDAAKQDEGKPGKPGKPGEQQQQQKQQEQQSQAVEIDWKDPKDAEVSPEIAGVRQGLQTYMGELGLTSEQANNLIGIARRYSNAPMTDAEAFAKQRATDEIFKKEWGQDYEANAKAIRQVIKNFEKRMNHADLDAAIDNGLWLDPDINRALLEVARRQDPVKGDLIAIRKELLTVNQGSPRWHELNKAFEAANKKLYGTGRA